MPQQKDLKRVVRTRMQKTGESYTAARLNVVRNSPPEPDYADLAGLSDEAVLSKTGRGWREWVAVLDGAGCASMPHREIARYVASLGTPSWWTQSVTVGYERIRGLRVKGQKCTGDFEASKSRTFAAPVATLYAAFANARVRRKWLPGAFEIRTSAVEKRMRVGWPDGTLLELYFTAKGPAKSAVAVQHSKLADKPAAERMKAWWSERLEALAQLLG